MNIWRRLPAITPASFIHVTRERRRTDAREAREAPGPKISHTLHPRDAKSETSLCPLFCLEKSGLGLMWSRQGRGGQPDPFFPFTAHLQSRAQEPSRAAIQKDDHESTPMTKQELHALASANTGSVSKRPNKQKSYTGKQQKRPDAGRLVCMPAATHKSLSPRSEHAPRKCRHASSDESPRRCSRKTVCTSLPLFPCFLDLQWAHTRKLLSPGKRQLPSEFTEIL